jgi:hypothetical protein
VAGEPPTDLDGAVAGEPPTDLDGAVAGEPPTDLDGAVAGEPPTDLDGDGPPVAQGWNDAHRLPDDLARRYVSWAPMTAGAQAHPFRAVTPDGDVHVVRLPRGQVAFADVGAFMDLDHPNLVRVLEQGTTAEGVPFQILEYVPGETLARRLAATGAWSGRDVRRLLEQLAGAIEALAGRGFVHSDLTPANVVCDGDGAATRYVVVDYGLSYRADHTIMEGVGGRTERYTPPEAFLGYRSRSWDWWSLGMIVAQALLGRHPLAGADVRHVKLAVGLGRFDVSGITDGRFASLVSGLLTVDLDGRWGSEQVRAWLAGEDPPVAGTEHRGGAVAPAPPVFRFGGHTFRADPRRLADALGSTWEDAARALGTPVVRTELARWCAQFGDADLLAVVGAAGGAGSTPDHDLIRLIGALYGVPRADGAGRGRGRSWYHGTVLTPRDIHSWCAEALTSGEGLVGWSGDLADLGEEVSAGARHAVALVQGDLRVLGRSAGPASALSYTSRQLDAGREQVRGWTQRLDPPREPGEEVLWAVRLLSALTRETAARDLAEEARVAVRRRRDLQPLLGPNTAAAHHLAATILARRTRRRRLRRDRAA